ncbi:MAG: nucleotidyltransferase domain-containing protein [Pseudomonadota bacterium]
MPAAIATIPRAVRGEINAQLDAIERDHNVRILFAVESGSRAWGFPSPDSDYDVRFVYVHSLDWYLSIDKRRDVIELPINAELDINGWDLKKALRLLIKPNPVLLEWLRSPVIYRADKPAMTTLARLSLRTAHKRPSTYHYLRLAETQYRRFIADKETVALKKYFYSLRPALALMWLRSNAKGPLPMAISDLRDGVDLPAETSDIIEDLLQQKAKSRELGRGPRAAALDTLIEHEIALAQDATVDETAMDPDIVEAANRVFRKLVLKDG